MKRFFMMLLAMACTVTAFAQTKKIEHRSHSGSDRTFTTKGDSNFGLSPEAKRRMDSLRRVDMRKDSIAKAKKADSLKRAAKNRKDSTKARGKDQ